MAQQKGRRIAHFAAGGYAGPGAITATAQGLPSATPAGGYTPGAETNAAGSWGAGAQSGGIAGDTNVSPVGAPDTSAFTQPGNYVAPAAALPAAAANTAMAPTPAPTSGSTAMQASMPGGYGTPGENSGLMSAEGGAIPERMKDGGTVQNMKRGGKVRQMKPNGKPGSSQPPTTPHAPQPPTAGRPPTPLRQPLPPGTPDPNSDAMTGGPYGNPMGGDQPPSAIPAGAPAPGFKRGGRVSQGFDTSAYMYGDQSADGRKIAPTPPAKMPTPSAPQAGANSEAETGGPYSNPMGEDQPAFDEGGAAPDPGDAGGGDQSQQSGGPSPAVQSALTAARSQFGLNDNMFNMMSQGLSSQTADNQETPRPIQPAPNGGPKKPFNPRDFVPGGSKASDSGDGTKVADNQDAPRPIGPAPNGPPTKPFNPRDYLPSAAGGGAIPEFDGGGSLAALAGSQGQGFPSYNLIEGQAQQAEGAGEKSAAEAEKIRAQLGGSEQ